MKITPHRSLEVHLINNVDGEIAMLAREDIQVSIRSIKAFVLYKLLFIRFDIFVFLPLRTY